METVQLFLTVDEQGNIMKAFAGENIIATDPYDFFFLTDQATADNVGLYKVVMQGMKPQLVLK